MSARGAMIQRMTLQRNVAVDPGDGYEHAPVWQTLYEDLPCRYWVRASPQLISSQEFVGGSVEAIVRDARLICPLVDIRETDRISEIRDRQGNVQIAGPLEIRGKEERFVHGKHHTELLIREIK
jgi:hypothetical protein